MVAFVTEDTLKLLKKSRNMWGKRALCARKLVPSVFILTPVLSDEQMKETVAKFKKVLTDKGAEILNEETWGLKKMAYAIQKKSTGFYCLIEFKAEPSVIKTLETSFRRDEKVIRFQTVKLDKYAIEYAEKRRNKLGKKEEA